MGHYILIWTRDFQVLWAGIDKQSNFRLFPEMAHRYIQSERHKRFSAYQYCYIRFFHFSFSKPYHSMIIPRMIIPQPFISVLRCRKRSHKRMVHTVFCFCFAPLAFIFSFFLKNLLKDRRQEFSI